MRSESSGFSETVRPPGGRGGELGPGRFRLAMREGAQRQGGEPGVKGGRVGGILGSGASGGGGGGAPDQVGLAAVLLNAGAAIYVAGIAASLAEGIGRAREVVASGAARAALERLRKATASIS